MDLHITTSDVNGSTVVKLQGEIDVYTAPRLRDCLIRLVGEGHRKVVLDLQDVEFLDSTGLGVMVGGLKRLRAHGGGMTIVCDRDPTLKVFEISGLSRVFDICPDFQLAAQ